MPDNAYVDVLDTDIDSDSPLKSSAVGQRLADNQRANVDQVLNLSSQGIVGPVTSSSYPTTPDYVFRTRCPKGAKRLTVRGQLLVDIASAVVYATYRVGSLVNISARHQEVEQTHTGSTAPAEREWILDGLDGQGRWTAGQPEDLRGQDVLLELYLKGDGSAGVFARIEDRQDSLFE